MISIIVYGRNDDRGYGMHKRVTLSLNALAEVLSGQTSEIIFVDYNTPNHLPTLPELIRDMLTERARQRTRVLRVRPSIHARFSAYSTLPVLEPIARNVALRRSRQQNAWILSTNTDSIIVPPPGRSLCDVVSELGGTHYGTPRFELPERLWEALDRMDPAGAIQRVSDWGEMARLNEIVRGQGVIQFDNPGDFQLVRRSTLFGMDGFDEEALLGWHVDHNLAHRLSLKHGPERDLSKHIKLYHCGHARQPTATHSQNKNENDVQRFVHQVRQPSILRQRDVWGCIDDEIGEINLDHTTTLGLLDAIERAVAPLAGVPLEAAYTEESYDALWYDAGHVGVHLLDLLSTFPRDVTVGFNGCRRDLADILAIGLGALGFVRPLVVPHDVAKRLELTGSEPIEIWPSERMIAEADVLVYEFGLVRDGGGAVRAAAARTNWTDAEAKALESVSAAFLAGVHHERTVHASNRPERMFVAVNSVNSRFEQLVSSCLLATPSPYTTRLRFGAVLQEAAHQASVAPSLGVALRAADFARAQALVATLLGDRYAETPDRMVLASHGRLIAELFQQGKLAIPDGYPHAEVERRLAIVRTPAEEYAHFPQPSLVDVHDDFALSRLARLRDFEIPSWVSAARRVSPGIARGKIRRDIWMWERAQLVRGLADVLRPDGRERALLVSEHPDDIVPALADMFARLDAIDLRSLLGRDAPTMLRTGDFATGPHLYGETMRVARATELAGTGYDAIVLPHNAAFRFGVCGLGPLIARLRPSLRPGGVLAIGGEVGVTGRGRAERPDWPTACDDGFPRILAESAGLRLLASNFTGIEPGDAALVGSMSDIDANLPVLGIRRNGEVFWPATWFFEALGRSKIDESLDLGLANLMLGEQVAFVTVSDKASRLGGAILAVAGTGDGHIFYGPYAKLPKGSFLATIVVDPAVSTNRRGLVRLVAEVAIGPEIVVQQEVEVEASGWHHSVQFQLAFSMPAEWSVHGEGRPCEVRLWSDGKAGFEVRSVTLSPASR
jgi:hypothetical protein